MGSFLWALKIAVISLLARSPGLMKVRTLLPMQHGGEQGGGILDGIKIALL